MQSEDQHSQMFLTPRDLENISVLDLIHPCKHAEAAFVNMFLFFLFSVLNMSEESLNSLCSIICP